jgi:hypothetical protein
VRFPALPFALILLTLLCCLPHQAQTLTQITRNNATDSHPTLSADGRYLAWAGYDVARRRQDLHVLDARTSRRTTVVVPVPAIERLCMSGDGRTVFFMYYGTLWSVPRQGGTPRSLNRNGWGFTSANAFSASHDGSLLCYAVGQGTRAGLEVLTVATGRTVDVAKNLPVVPNLLSGHISGDGKTAVVNTQSNLSLVGTDGTVIRQLNTGPAASAIWGPKIDHFGTICAFEAVVNGGYRVLSTYTKGGITTITSPSTLWQSRGPMMAANGDRVTWISGNANIAHPDGTGYRLMTQDGGLNPGTSAYFLHTVNGDGSVAALASRGNFRGGNPEGDYEIYLWRDSLTRTGTATSGQTVTFHMEDAARAGAVYVARCAFSRRPGLNLPGIGTVPLTPDPLFQVSGRLPAIFRKFTGVLDDDGRGTYSIAIPANPGLRGFTFFTSFVAVGTGISLHPALKVLVH